MSFAINQVILGGNLVRDPEQGETKGGKVKVTTALGQSKPLASGDDEGSSQYWNLVVFDTAQNNNLATRMMELFDKGYLSKGKGVTIFGRIQQDSRQTEEGTKYYTFVIVDQLFLGGGAGRQAEEGSGEAPRTNRPAAATSQGSTAKTNTSGAPSRTQARPAPASRPAAPARRVLSDDDLPF